MITFDRTDQSVFGRWWWTVDRWQLGALAILMMVGTVLITAASPPVAERIGIDDTFYFVERHLLMLIPTVMIMVGVSLLEPRDIRRLALIIFYTLLVSISEHLTFGAGYLISSVATILLITGYARGILGKATLSAVVGCILTILYGYLYILLQLEDYALLLGSVGLFTILAVVMYLTRKINWYAVGQPPPIQ